MVKLVTANNAISVLARAMLALVLLTGAGCSGESGSETSGTAADTSASGPDAKTFYQKEVLHIIVGYNPGGGFDEYARMIGTEMATRTGGTVVVENQPGGGGLLALNRLVQEKGDGTRIMLLGGESAVLAQLTGRPGTRFDITKLNWLGRAQIDTPIVLWSMTNPERTFAEVLNTIQTEGAIWGATGLTDNLSDAEAAMAHALGLSPEKSGIVMGYAGSSEVALAVVRGEVDGIVVSNSSAINYVGSAESQSVVPIATLSRKRETTFFPDVPTIFEVAELNEEGQWWIDFRSSITEVGRTFVTHGDVPADRVAYLRQVLGEILTDQKFIAMATEHQRPINYMSAEDQEKLVQGIFSGLSPERVQEVKHVLTEKYIR
jgi:tripartite-type tricarboxylate transporter receptor subunit TctC